MTTIHCPSCGGPTELKRRSVQVLVCSYCSTTIALTRDGETSEHGKSAPLVDLFTDLSTGGAGKVRGRSFHVAGRVRYAYNEGYWDEWAVDFDDGTSGWLHEDEGELSLLVQQPLSSPVDFSSARVGSRIAVDGVEVYVTEKRSATVHGAEGQLPRGVFPGATLDYVDGTVGQQHYMLEQTDAGVELFIGEVLDDDALEVYGT